MKNKEDILVTHPELAKEWHPRLNGTITPKDITLGSHKKAWWICKEGHKWEARIADRVRGRGCPYCTGQLVVKGLNDLNTIYSEISKEWNYQKNGTLAPTNVFKCSRKKVWWACKEGHEWEAKIYNRINGNGCPYCSGKIPIEGETDLQTTHSNIAEEWNIDKNKCLKPTNVSAGSNKKVWWICKEGHEWQAQVNNRARGTGCPFCSGRLPIVGKTDLATTHPWLIKEWNYAKNKDLYPSEVTAFSHKKIWWTCKDGHEWLVSVSKRVQGSKCPYCLKKKAIKGVNDITITHPFLIEEWNYTFNDLSPSNLSAGSSRKVYWKCKYCGFEWKAIVSNRTRGSGCPKCKGHNVKNY